MTTTRLSLMATPGSPYGNFVGKEEVSILPDGAVRVVHRAASIPTVVRGERINRRVSTERIPKVIKKSH